MADEDEDTKRREQAGFNPLFFGVLVALALGGVAAAGAGGATLLHSNVIFRLAVGGAAALVAYLAVVALWLAWHRRPFRRIAFGNAALETDDATQEEITQRDIEVAEFMGTTTQALEELGRRVDALERQDRGQQL